MSFARARCSGPMDMDPADGLWLGFEDTANYYSSSS